MEAEQLALFPVDRAGGEYGVSVAQENAPLSAQSSLAAAMIPFRDFMLRQGFTQHTINSFLGDMRLVMRYLRAGTPLCQVRTKQLDDFLTWLSRRRGTPCSPKSYARRVTTLKVFFHWLKEENILPVDPAAPVLQLSAVSPLPLILYENQIAQVLAATEGLMSGEKPDARPHLLITLLLATGIKKSECMAIKLSHIDLSNTASPVLYIRYDNARYRLKERKLRLPESFPTTLSHYQAQYHPKTQLFECTARNLEYVLADIATHAGLPEGLSFEMLRWTCAVRDYQSGMEEDHLRLKLGLSPISWRDTLEKIRTLARPAL